MDRYQLIAWEYACDGVWVDTVLTVGSYKECQQREAFIDDLVYRDWDIILYDKDEENKRCR
jgi:hypothetical protein